MKKAHFAHSNWISSPLVGGPRTSVPCPYFRRSFVLNKEVQRAVLRITALGLYECEINGTRIGEEALDPGWTDYRKTLYAQRYDITEGLRLGENAIGVILGDGWFCGFVAYRNRQVYGDRPYLLVELEVTFCDGSRLALGTDAAWKTLAGPLLESDLLMGEAYDARLEWDGWSSPGFDDRGWAPVRTEVPEVSPEILEHPGPGIQRFEEFTPIRMNEIPYWSGNFKIYDLGQNFAGRTRITVRAARGRVIRLRHAEVLNPDGSIYTRNLRSARADDSYVCRGDGIETWEPKFTFHGFRYVEVTGLQEGDDFELAGVALYSAMAPTGTFACSNPLLNQLQSNILWSQKSNFLDVPTDCPQRDERMGWTGDAQVFIETACFNMDVRGFFHKWMRDVRDGQLPNGAVPCVIPNLDIHTIFDEDGGPAWSDATIICPWMLYLCYNDRLILEEHYDSMRRYFDFLLTHRCVDLIRAHPEAEGWSGYGDWLALDGSGSDFSGTPHDFIGTAFLAYDAEILSKIATILDFTEDAERFKELRDRIGKAFSERFLSLDGLPLCRTQTAAVLVLKFGLVATEHRGMVAQRLVQSIEENDWHLGTGFVGTPYLLGVLEDAGHLDVAYRLLEQETFPSWLFPIRNGATTIWERWDAWTTEGGFQGEGMNSFNHYAYGAVGAWMYRSVAGIAYDPECPGYRHIIFRPRPGGTLTWAEASLVTPQGNASIRWELTSNGLVIWLTVPEGSNATLDLPAGYETLVPLAPIKSGCYEIHAHSTIYENPAD